MKFERRDGSVAELARNARRSVKFGAAGAMVAAAALMGLGAGTAVADDLTPQPAVPGEGPVVEGGVRSVGGPGVVSAQGETRASGVGDVQAQGAVNGNNARVLGKATPTVTAWSYSGAGGDISACVFDMPYCSFWLQGFPNPSWP